MSINLEFLNNQIDAETQVSFPYYFDGTPKEKATYRVMFIGNSITIHEPKEEIGWTKKCGMAASDIDHDYVHLVYRYFLTKHPKTSICVFNGGQWELDFTNKNKLKPIINSVKRYKPDIVIVRIGENFNKDYIKQGIDPYIGFSNLVKGIKKTSENIYITSLFWKHDLIDEAIARVALDEFAIYVKINDLGSQRRYLAYDQYKNDAIYCGHPGDLGMERIAKRIIKKIKNHN